MKGIARHSALLVLMVLLQLPTAVSQREVSIGPARPDSPKTLTFKFVREEDSIFNLERLNSSEIILEKDGVRLVSSPITIQDSEGSCTIPNVAPGFYRLSLPILRMTTGITITVPPRPVTAVKIIVTFKRKGMIISPEPAK